MNALSGSHRIHASELPALNRELAARDAAARVRWCLEHLPGRQVLSSSFGAQAAVTLHLLVRERPDIPVILLDTGYLFPETYRYVDELTARLSLNLKVYRADLSPAWQEARHGRLWERGAAGIDEYNRINKLEPMRRAFRELNVSTWYAGLRRDQAATRARIEFVEAHADYFKAHPIADWTNRDVHEYLKRHGLPPHPLTERGYVSIGDTHTTRPLEAGMSEAQTRFFGLKRECGLHREEATREDGARDCA